MKRLLLLLLCLVLLPINIKAYENNYFNIDIPEGYLEVIEEDNVYTWNSDNENKIPSIIITVENNPATNKQNIDKFTKENLNEYQNTIKTTINDSLKEYNLSVKISELTIGTINNYKYLTYTSIWPTKESFGYDMYQKSYVFTTEKYITTIIYSTDNEKDQNSEGIKKILKSFKINDSFIKEQGFFSKRSNQIIVVGIIAGIIGYIISACKKKKN